MKIWIASEVYPESLTVLAGQDEESLLASVVAHVGREQYDEFVATLKGGEITDVAFDDEPRKVLGVWAGEFAPAEDGEGYFVGNDWYVRTIEVAGV